MLPEQGELQCVPRRNLYVVLREGHEARPPLYALPNHQPPAALCVAVVRTPYSDGIQMWV
jgi:hypothetical protein